MLGFSLSFHRVRVSDVEADLVGRTRLFAIFGCGGLSSNFPSRQLSLGQQILRGFDLGHDEEADVTMSKRKWIVDKYTKYTKYTTTGGLEIVESRTSATVNPASGVNWPAEIDRLASQVFLTFCYHRLRKTVVYHLFNISI